MLKTTQGVILSQRHLIDDQGRKLCRAVMAV